MNKYFYLAPKYNTPIYILAKRKPGIHTMRRSGTWVVKEWDSKSKTWIMPCFPEITLKKLKECQYIGKVKIDE